MQQYQSKTKAPTLLLSHSTSFFSHSLHEKNTKRAKMKRNSYSYCSVLFLLFAFLMLSSSFSASARLLLLEQAAPNSLTKGSSDVEKDQLVMRREDQKAAAANLLKEDDFSTLMGAEDLETAEEVCTENDEDCLKRRMVTEAHLDYIYTQHHKDP